MKLVTASFILLSIGLYGLILSDYFWMIKSQSRLELLTILYLLLIIIQSVMFFMKDILLKKWSNDKLSTFFVMPGVIFFMIAMAYEINDDTRGMIGFFYGFYVIGYLCFMLHQYKLLHNQEKKAKPEKNDE